jgi:hypothetical protein
MLGIFFFFNTKEEQHVESDYTWPAKPEIFTIWPFTKKVFPEIDHGKL